MLSQRGSNRGRRIDGSSRLLAYDKKVEQLFRLSYLVDRSDWRVVVHLMTVEQIYHFTFRREYLSPSGGLRRLTIRRAQIGYELVKR